MIRVLLLRGMEIHKASSLSPAQQKQLVEGAPNAVASVSDVHGLVL